MLKAVASSISMTFVCSLNRLAIPNRTLNSRPWSCKRTWSSNVRPKEIASLRRWSTSNRRFPPGLTSINFLKVCKRLNKHLGTQLSPLSTYRPCCLTNSSMSTSVKRSLTTIWLNWKRPMKRPNQRFSKTWTRSSREGTWPGPKVWHFQARIPQPEMRFWGQAWTSTRQWMLIRTRTLTFCPRCLAWSLRGTRWTQFTCGTSAPKE